MLSLKTKHDALDFCIKMDQLIHGSGENMRISICVRVYSGFRNVVQLMFRSDLWATRGPRGVLAPSLLVPL